jgi:uncharacterized protein (TIGR02594 family)
MILLNRRRLILGATAGAILAGRANGARADEEVVVADDFSGPLPATFLGTKRPLDSEEKAAQAILDAAPDSGPPVRIAEYLNAMPDKHYKEGWPDRWNPVIVGFFEATATKPSGDVTAWCAAFLNWCLQRSNLDFPDNASSSAFRKWKTETDDPKPGDIVVYVETNEEAAREGHGHVGFFYGFNDKGQVLTLGGNQIASNRHHEISVKALPGRNVKGGVLALHSFRTADGYRAA